MQHIKPNLFCLSQFTERLSKLQLLENEKVKKTAVPTTFSTSFFNAIKSCMTILIILC